MSEFDAVLPVPKGDPVALEYAVGKLRLLAGDGLRLVTELAEHGVELYGTLDPPGLTATVLSPPLAVPADLGQELLATGTEEVPL